MIAILATAGGAIETIIQFTRDAALATDGRDQAWLSGALVHTFIKGAFPALIGGAVVSLITICIQLGWPPALKGVKFDLSKMNPMANLGNAFGLKGMAQRTATTFAKMAVIGGIVLVVLQSGIVPHAVDAGELGQIAWSVIKKSLLVVVGAIVALAVVDFIMAKRRISEQMKMTPDEVKREHKDSEGDPMIKMRRRQKAREMAKRRIAVTVPTADVIIVNPTHYAVALRYDDTQDRAPIVVAKGVDDVAQRIREIAREKGIPIMARPPLARALHKHVKEGKQVPANLYKAVAEVLAYVYRLRGGRK
ncbi:hypothetical protein BH11MYX2_BH11MYX2_13560 [soil metagenome]